MIPGADHGGELERGVARLNRFLFERTGGEKYATIFYCQVERDGSVRYVNAAHCPPMVLRSERGNGRAGSHRHAGRADRRRGIRSGRIPAFRPATSS